MKTRMQSSCDGTCCKPEVKQPNALSHMTSGCDCYRRKVECGDQCKCDPSTCNNRQMSLKQSVVLGVDVEERTAWGIDLCTACNLLEVLPSNLPITERSKFIETKLMFAVQQ